MQIPSPGREGRDRPRANPELSAAFLAQRIQFFTDQMEGAEAKADKEGWKRSALGAVGCMEELDARAGYPDPDHTARLAEFRQQVESGVYADISF